MKAIHWFAAGLLGMLLGGCGSMQTPPAAEARQALAPTGKLRVAFLSGPLYALKDPGSGELKGVAVDLGAELARRVGVPFQPVVYPNPGAIVAGAKSAEWDVALMGVNAERAAAMDFSQPYMEVEQTYLVRAGVPIAAISDVDKPGVRVGLLAMSGADVLLSRTLKNATLVRVRSVPELYGLLDSGGADVVAASTTALWAGAQDRPGSRVLDGRILAEPIGMGVPKGRDPAAVAYIGRFVEDAKAKGVVKSAIEGARLRGVVVPSTK